MSSISIIYIKIVLNFSDFDNCLSFFSIMHDVVGTNLYPFEFWKKKKEHQDPTKNKRPLLKPFATNSDEID